jgi:hypothetical protein
MELANEIIRQLGGAGKLKMFTGAKNFIALDNGVSFRIGNRKTNYVKIVLNSMDTYDVTFALLRSGKMVNVREFNGIYNDGLKELFERETGMYLSFEKGGSTTYAEGGKIYDETNYNANEQVISTKKTNISNLDTRLKPFSQDKKRYKVKIIRGKGMRIDKVEVYQKNFDKWRLFKTYTQKSKGNTYAEGGEIIEINEDGSNLPKPLYELFGELDEDEDTYKEMERLRLKANELGYDFDYDLSGQPTEFWKTNKMAKGGSIKSNWFKGELSFLNW